MIKKPIVWTIGGSDSGGGAGIQADLHTFQSLGVFGCSVVTAVTAQNSVGVGHVEYISPENIKSQLEMLNDDLPASALKLGMLGNVASIRVIIDFLKSFFKPIILDPVMFSTSGGKLFNTNLNEYQKLIKELASLSDLITPNRIEAENITGRSLKSYEDFEQAANDILSLGVKSVLIKGGHFNENNFSQDYWSNGNESFWLCSERQPAESYHGTGCTLSAAIAACMGLGYDIRDSLVIAKMVINQGLRQTIPYGKGPPPVSHHGWPMAEADLPFVSKAPLSKYPNSFPNCGDTPLGLYPIVGNVELLKQILPLGIQSAQLRIKDKVGIELEKEIEEGITLAKKYSTRLFINDYWELAIRYGAYGVHLGQEDLQTSEIEKIYHAGLRLGVSTHCHYEIAKAHALRPSYMGYGPIYHTSQKILPYTPRGISELNRWCKTLSYPLIAIGGINIQNLPDVLSTGVSGVAMISAFVNTENPVTSIQKIMELYPMDLT